MSLDKDNKVDYSKDDLLEMRRAIDFLRPDVFMERFEPALIDILDSLLTE